MDDEGLEEEDDDDLDEDEGDVPETITDEVQILQNNRMFKIFIITFHLYFLLHIL